MYLYEIINFTDVPTKDTLTNIFALLAHTGTSTVWGPVQTMTVELYPTVIRYVKVTIIMKRSY